MSNNLIAASDSNSNSNSNRPASLFPEWFIQHNPLYFFSALCLLSGVFLVSDELNRLELVRGKIGLAAVLQLYEFMLIGGSLLLYRIGERRAAVILALLEVPFLYDCTMEIEMLAALRLNLLLIILLFIGLTAMKLAMLARALRVKISSSYYALALLAIVGLIGSNYLLAANIIECQIAYQLSGWYFAALIALVLALRPRAHTLIKLDSWGETVLARANQGVWLIGGAVYLLHLLSWTAVFNTSLSALHFAPFLLLVPLFTRNETAAWFGAFSVIITSQTPSFIIVPMGLSAALALLYFGWRSAQYRAWVGAVLIVYISFVIADRQHVSALPILLLHLWATLTLAVLAWKLKLRSAAALSAIFALIAGNKFSSGSLLNGGILLIIIGFLSLAAGIAINWQRAHAVRENLPKS